MTATGGRRVDGWVLIGSDQMAEGIIRIGTTFTESLTRMQAGLERSAREPAKAFSMLIQDGGRQFMRKGQINRPG